MPSPPSLGHSVFLHVLDMVLDPLVPGVGADGMAPFGDEAVEQEGEGSQWRGPVAGRESPSSLPPKFPT